MWPWIEEECFAVADDSTAAEHLARPARSICRRLVMGAPRRYDATRVRLENPLALFLSTAWTQRGSSSLPWCNSGSGGIALHACGVRNGLVLSLSQLCS